jgi:hypothetical protein
MLREEPLGTGKKLCGRVAVPQRKIGPPKAHAPIESGVSSGRSAFRPEW